jgi:hypothetical protein
MNFIYFLFFKVNRTSCNFFPILFVFYIDIWNFEPLKSEPKLFEKDQNCTSKYLFQVSTYFKKTHGQTQLRIW